MDRRLPALGGVNLGPTQMLWSADQKGQPIDELIYDPEMGDTEGANDDNVDRRLSARSSPSCAPTDEPEPHQ